MARRVLVVEDDAETASQPAECLRSGGYDADLAADGAHALDLARAADYAVMTVDRLLPKINGLEVIRRLRGEGSFVPALIISALGEVDDRIRGLRVGGDDYLVKPFSSLQRCWRVSMRWRGAAQLSPVRRCCGSAISRSICLPARPATAAARSNSCRGNSDCSNTWCATPARLCRARFCCSTSGICISTRRPTSSTSMSAACARSSMAGTIR